MLMPKGKRVCTPLVDYFERTVAQTIHNIVYYMQTVSLGIFRRLSHIHYRVLFWTSLHKWQARIDFCWIKLHSSGSGPLGQRDAHTHTFTSIWYAQFIYTLFHFVHVIKTRFREKKKRTILWIQSLSLSHIPVIAWKKAHKLSHFQRS